MTYDFTKPRPRHFPGAKVSIPNLDNYERRVRELEAEGMTRSDAQAVADAELLNEAT